HRPATRTAAKAWHRRRPPLSIASNHRCTGSMGYATEFMKGFTRGRSFIAAVGRPRSRSRQELVPALKRRRFPALPPIRIRARVTLLFVALLGRLLRRRILIVQQRPAVL